jgi:hypothetical protein
MICFINNVLFYFRLHLLDTRISYIQYNNYTEIPFIVFTNLFTFTTSTSHISIINKMIWTRYSSCIWITCIVFLSEIHFLERFHLQSIQYFSAKRNPPYVYCKHIKCKPRQSCINILCIFFMLLLGFLLASSSGI